MGVDGRRKRRTNGVDDIHAVDDLAEYDLEENVGCELYRIDMVLRAFHLTSL